MASDKSSAVRRAEAMALSTGEQMVIAIRTGLQLLPFGVGSAIETGYFGTIDARRLKRIEQWVAALGTELDRLEVQCRSVPGHFFESDEFAYFLEGTLRRVNFEVSRQKLDALRGILVSVVVGQPSLEFEKKCSFLKTIDSVEGVHLAILQLLVSRQSHDEPLRYVGYPEICRLVGASKESDVSFVYSALDTLANREFVLSGPIPLQPDGRLAKEKQTFRSTQLGAEFLRFVRARPTTDD